MKKTEKNFMRIKREKQNNNVQKSFISSTENMQ